MIAKIKMLNLKRIVAVSKKESIQIIRDPRSLALGLAIPIILIVLFGTALSLDIENVPMAIWDRDGSKASRDFILNFRNSHYFKIYGYYDNYQSIEKLIDYGDISLGMVIPNEFGRLLDSGQQAPVQFIFDGGDSNTATISLGYVSSIVGALNTAMLRESLESRSIVNTLPIDMRQRVWFNQDFQSKNFIVPGLIAIIMMIIAALLTSLTVAREWERGTMEQLISTPVRPLEIIVGKFIPYFFIGMIDLVIAIFMGKFIFNVPFHGSLLLLLILSAIFLTGALSMGIFISSVAKNQLMASQLAILTSFIPTFLLSGFTYEIFNMPQWVQVITHIVPARYFITILRGIYLKGVGIKVLWPEVLAIIIFTCIMGALAVKKLRKKIL